VIKWTIVIFYLIGALRVIAEDDIVLIDDSYKSNMVQKDIQGCLDDDIISRQKRQIRELKRELRIVLKKLSKMEREIANSTKETTLYRPKIENTPKVRGKYIIVRVKRGDTLSKYAKKFYGDEKKYYRIYLANRDKIGRDFKLRVGDKIIIPLPSNREEGIIGKNLKKYKKSKYNQNYYIPRRNQPKKRENPDKKIEMLDEVVYIDDNLNSQDEVIFIPLDEN